MKMNVSRRKSLQMFLFGALTQFPFISIARDQMPATSRVSPRTKHRFIQAAMRQLEEEERREIEEMAKRGEHPFMIVSTLTPFADWDFYYVNGGGIRWGPNLGTVARVEVTVPEGFVTDLASIPRIFWSIRRPEGRHAFAAVVHDFLYWTQTKPREEADEIFKQALLDSRIGRAEAETMYQAVRRFGQSAWEDNKRLRNSGERRILKKLPTDYTVSWKDWKKMPDVFAES